MSVSARTLITVGEKNAELLGRISAYDYYDNAFTLHIAVKVYNTGSQASGPFQTTFLLVNNAKQSEVLETVQTKKIAARANTVIDVTHTFSESLHGKKISVLIDDTHQVSEVNEANNGLQTILTSLKTQ